jgi:hypothetical protein
MYKVFFDPTNEIFMPNNLHCHVAVSLVARNGEQSWTFSLQRRRRKGRATAVVNRQYGSENVTLQTDKPTESSCPVVHVGMQNQLLYLWNILL